VELKFYIRVQEEDIKVMEEFVNYGPGSCRPKWKMGEVWVEKRKGCNQQT